MKGFGVNEIGIMRMVGRKKTEDNLVYASDDSRTGKRNYGEPWAVI